MRTNKTVRMIHYSFIAGKYFTIYALHMIIIFFSVFLYCCHKELTKSQNKCKSTNCNLMHILSQRDLNKLSSRLKYRPRKYKNVKFQHNILKTAFFLMEHVAFNVVVSTVSFLKIETFLTLHLNGFSIHRVKLVAQASSGV